MTVNELLGKVDSAELTEWMAYFQMEAEGRVTTPADESAIWRKAFNAYG